MAINVSAVKAPVASPKPVGRRRIVVLGGSAVFGSGASWDTATLPARRQVLLSARGGREIEVVNAVDAEIVETYRRNVDRMVSVMQARGVCAVCVDRDAAVIDGPARCA